jgi:hypothetical protein
MYRETYCARTGPLPLLPSGPGGVSGIAPRRTRHMIHDSTVNAWITALYRRPYLICQLK